MADFRRVVTALAVLALLSGFAITANAQGVAAPFGCTASAASTPAMRAEGITELIGDIVLTCSGGVAPAVGSAIAPTQQANISVFLNNMNVTSRIMTTSGSVSDAVLLIDEPGTAIGSSQDFVPCGTPTSGCLGTVGAAGSTTTYPNTFRGIVSGNSVTFLGVPVIPPGTQGGNRIFRITNVRGNASQVGVASGLAAPTPVTAFIGVSGPTAFPIANPTPIVGYVQQGLNFTVRDSGGDQLASGGLSFAQCNGPSKKTIQALLRFSERFPTAFKLNALEGQAATPTLNLITNTESGLILTGITGTTSVGTTFAVGQADSSTRLRASFSNIPTGATIYVSTTNVGGVAGTAPYAVLTANETGPFTPVTPTDVFNSVNVFQVPSSGVVVWEVQAANPSKNESLDFNVYVSSSSTVATGVQGKVAGTFAPLSTVLTASAGPIPRFADTGTPTNLVTFYQCQTTLLFPFVTARPGGANFDTGIAIANTTTDPLTNAATGAEGATPTDGSCTLSFFGNITVPQNTLAIKSGTVGTWLMSSVADGFQGYVFAQCNFQFGHGFAFISDVGSNQFAMGYLALVLPELPRFSTTSAVGTGEILGQ